MSRGAGGGFEKLKFRFFFQILIFMKKIYYHNKGHAFSLIITNYIQIFDNSKPPKKIIFNIIFFTLPLFGRVIYQKVLGLEI